MDLSWGDEKTIQFVTNVGLITSSGPHGDNVMAAEWTHHVSYSPGLIAVCVGFGKATAENIESAGFFGVNIAAADQNVFASIAGGNSGKDVDKIAALKELGYKFYRAEKINILMVDGAVLNFECKLVNKIVLGDHIMFVGEIQDSAFNPDKKLLVYHGLKFWKLSENLQKPDEKELERIKNIVEKHRKVKHEL